MLEQVAKSRDLGGLAITNHDYHEPSDSDGVVTIPGIEISTSRGHVLVVGPEPPATTKSGEMDPGRVIVLALDGGAGSDHHLFDRSRG